MSQEERDDLYWLKRVEAGSMTQREAAEKMGVTPRWVRQLVKRMKKQGDAVVVHRLRGRASNRKLSAKIQRQALTILKKPDWHDFGPTFAAEQLAKRHQIQEGKETLHRARCRAQCDPKNATLACRMGVLWEYLEKNAHRGGGTHAKLLRPQIV